MSERDVDAVAGKSTTSDKIRWKFYAIKNDLYMKWHKLFWRTLWATNLATPYSLAMCRLGWYRKYPDGRCHYCGKIK